MRAFRQFIEAPACRRSLRLFSSSPASSAILLDYRPPIPNIKSAARRLKAIRVEAAKNAARYDKYIGKDSDRVLVLEQVSEWESQERLRVAGRITEVLQAGLGDDFEVIDMSPYVWGAQFAGGEIELAISPLKPLPPNEDAEFSKGYSARSIVEILRSEGLAADIVDVPRKFVYSRSGHFIVRPAPSTDDRRLVLLLSDYIHSSPWIRVFMGMFRAWLNSHFEERHSRLFTTSMVAVVAIGYLQSVNVIQILKIDEIGGETENENESANANADLKIDRYRFHSKNHASKVLGDLEFSKTSYVPAVAQAAQTEEGKSFRRLVAGFFKYLSEVVDKERMLSIRRRGMRHRGEAVPGWKPPTALQEKQKAEQELRLSLSRVDEDTLLYEQIQASARRSGTVEQPEAWQQQPLVIEHPCDPQINLAAHIPKLVAHNLRHFATRALVLIRTETPLPSVFGPEVPPSSGLTLAELYAAAPPIPVRHPNLVADLQAMYSSATPDRAILEGRSAAIDDLMSILNGQGQYHVEIKAFGSTVYVDTKTSDLDLVILDERQPKGFPHEFTAQEIQRSEVYDMRWLAEHMKESGLFDDIMAIPGAQVPIVRARHVASTVKVDINTNDRLGHRNTELLLAYCNLVPMLRPVLFYIKWWARRHGFIDPSARNGAIGFSSYCLTVMTVSYLQARGVLPSLQALVTEPFRRWMDGVVYARLQSDTRILADTRFVIPEEWEAPEISVADMLVGWFKYWGEGHPYGDKIASISAGGMIPRQDPISVSKVDTTTELGQLPNELGELSRDTISKLAGGPGNDTESMQPEIWKRASLVVQDPFIRSKNLAQSIDGAVLRNFRMACLQSYERLDRGQPLAAVMQKSSQDGQRTQGLQTRGSGPRRQPDRPSSFRRTEQQTHFGDATRPMRSAPRRHHPNAQW